ncbi:phage recombination protein Bet [Mycolicibacterium porcinum]|uniref:phage recombination protein Bet n=1 Tax=Mycolicibacterium porcinum TaxID=39693 RepID=UPI00080B057A|nr:phage recombination protein Bet [Mycolicibacterium porcinum]OCB09273.1 phage recombination protein Bet [Mycolicibacterium porcinum]
MTTTTAERTETITGPDLNPQPPQNLPVVAGIPQQFSEFNLAVRRMLGLEDASDGEIELFFHVCQKSGLDPFNKEVYMIGRNTEVDRWEPVNPAEPDGQKRKVKRWVTKYTIQTGINGFRKRAREIAESKGIEFSQDDPLWCGEDGIWKEVWPDSKPPVAAKFVAYRDGHRYSFIAHYAEYVQTKNDGKPNHMWNKMPCNQTRKCAEAGALQAAFPDELGGLLLDDAVQNEDADTVVIDEDGNAAPAQEPKKRRGGRGVGSLRDQAAKATKDADPAPPAEPEVIEGEVEQPGQDGGNDQSQDAEPSSGVTDSADSGDQEPTAQEKQQSAKTARRKAAENRLFSLFHGIPAQIGGGGQITRDERIAIYRSALGREDITSTDDLDVVEVAKVGDQIYQWGQDGKLADEINEIRNAIAIAQAETEKGNQ